MGRMSVEWDEVYDCNLRQAIEPAVAAVRAAAVFGGKSGDVMWRDISQSSVSWHPHHFGTTSHHPHYTTHRHTKKNRGKWFETIKRDWCIGDHISNVVWYVNDGGWQRNHWLLVRSSNSFRSGCQVKWISVVRTSLAIGSYRWHW